MWSVQTAKYRYSTPLSVYDIRGMNSFENLKKKNTFPQLFLLSTNLALEKARKDTVFSKLFQRPPSKPLIIKVQEKNLPQLTLVKSSSGRRGWWLDGMVVCWRCPTVQCSSKMAKISSSSSPPHDLLCPLAPKHHFGTYQFFNLYILYCTCAPVCVRVRYFSSSYA